MGAHEVPRYGYPYWTSRPRTRRQRFAAWRADRKAQTEAMRPIFAPTRVPPVGCHSTFAADADR